MAEADDPGEGQAVDNSDAPLSQGDPPDVKRSRRRWPWLAAAAALPGIALAWYAASHRRGENRQEIVHEQLPALELPEWAEDVEITCVTYDREPVWRVMFTKKNAAKRDVCKLMRSFLEARSYEVCAYVEGGHHFLSCAHKIKIGVDAQFGVPVFDCDQYVSMALFSIKGDVLVALEVSKDFAFDNNRWKRPGQFQVHHAATQQGWSVRRLFRYAGMPTRVTGADQIEIWLGDKRLPQPTDYDVELDYSYRIVEAPGEGTKWHYSYKIADGLVSTKESGTSSWDVTHHAGPLTRALWYLRWPRCLMPLTGGAAIIIIALLCYARWTRKKPPGWAPRQRR